MNFKKYHVSKNLFDISRFACIGEGAYSIDGTTVTMAGTTSAGLYYLTWQEYEAGTYLFTFERDTTLSCYYVIASDFPLSNSQLDGGYLSMSASVASRFNKSYAGFRATTKTSFTITSDVPFYFAIAPLQSAYTISNIMLNIGSTALPYEPYSSEVWHDIPHYIHNTSTDTLTTLPAVLYPNAVTATVGLQGNMQQTGTPSPTTPIQPSECGERTANLFDKNTITLDKFVTTGGEISSTNYYCSDYIPVSEGAYYLANVVGSSVQQGYVVYDSNKQAIRQGTLSGGKSVSGVVNISANEYYIRINMHIETSPDVVMVNSGSTALPYEPNGYKIPILSASTTTPVYLGEVQSTRRIKKLVLTGDEGWFLSTAQAGRFGLSLSDYLKSNETITSYCSHYTAIAQKSGGTAPNNSQYFYSGSDMAHYLFIVDTSCSTAADFKSYLADQYAAGTPVTVWYVLATPTTGIVNEPIRKIGDYADTVSGISIPTIAGANTLSIGTTLQPSEASVNYKGWHPVADVHERENGAWT